MMIDTNLLVMAVTPTVIGGGILILLQRIANSFKALERDVSDIKTSMAVGTEKFKNIEQRIEKLEATL